MRLIGVLKQLDGGVNFIEFLVVSSHANLNRDAVTLLARLSDMDVAQAAALV